MNGKVCLMIILFFQLVEDVLINVKDLPGAKEGDNIVIWDPELDEVQPRLLLQIPISAPNSRGMEVPKG